MQVQPPSCRHCRRSRRCFHRLGDAAGDDDGMKRTVVHLVVIVVTMTMTVIMTVMMMMMMMMAAAIVAVVLSSSSSSSSSSALLLTATNAFQPILSTTRHHHHHHHHHHLFDRRRHRRRSLLSSPLSSRSSSSSSSSSSASSLGVSKTNKTNTTTNNNNITYSSTTTTNRKDFVVAAIDGDDDADKVTTLTDIPILTGPWQRPWRKDDKNETATTKTTRVQFGRFGGGGRGGYWSQQRPVLLQGAFQQEVAMHNDSGGVGSLGGGGGGDDDTMLFPSWDELIELATVAVTGKEVISLEGGGEDEGDENFDYDDSEDDDDDDVPISRLVSCIPNQLDSYQVQFGPFDTQELKAQLNAQSNNDDDGSPTNRVSTLLLNDVDRWMPHLSDWMDQNFGMHDTTDNTNHHRPFALPRWRRDDAQISLSHTHGGIGPHVDQYDVFLIQVSGTRTWEVGQKPVSVAEEHALLVPDSQVSLLNVSTTGMATDNSNSSSSSSTLGRRNSNRGKAPMHPTTLLHLEPGDCLYVPPRFLHCGTSTSNNSITLSVGCRAPSAGDLVTRVAEVVRQAPANAAACARRFTDDVKNDDDDDDTVNNNNNTRTNALSDPSIRDGMKDLVMDAVRQVLDDDMLWDELVGTLVTEPKRSSGTTYPVPLVEMDQSWRDELGMWGSANPSTILGAVQAGQGVLRRAEGVSFGWSSPTHNTYRLFAQGRMYQVEVVDELDMKEHMDATANGLLDRLANGPPINKAFLDKMQPVLSLPNVTRFVEELIQEGLIYGDDDLKV